MIIISLLFNITDAWPYLTDMYIFTVLSLILAAYMINDGLKDKLAAGKWMMLSWAFTGIALYAALRLYCGWSENPCWVPAFAVGCYFLGVFPFTFTPVILILYSAGLITGYPLWLLLCAFVFDAIKIFWFGLRFSGMNKDTEKISPKKISPEEISSGDIESEEFKSEEISSEVIDSREVIRKEINPEIINPEKISPDGINPEEINPGETNPEA